MWPCLELMLLSKVGKVSHSLSAIRIKRGTRSTVFVQAEHDGLSIGICWPGASFSAGISLVGEVDDELLHEADFHIRRVELWKR